MRIGRLKYWVMAFTVFHIYFTFILYLVHFSLSREKYRFCGGEMLDKSGKLWYIFRVCEGVASTVFLCSKSTYWRTAWLAFNCETHVSVLSYTWSRYIL